MKEVRFPSNTKWVDLNSMEVLLAPSNTPLSLILKAGIDSDVLMFQAEGTVVPM